MQVSVTRSSEVVEQFMRENFMWFNYLLFARLFHMSRDEFETMTEDEIFATIAYIKENKLIEK